MSMKKFVDLDCLRRFHSNLVSNDGENDSDSTVKTLSVKAIEEFVCDATEAYTVDEIYEALNYTPTT